ncbi:hypothetical protein ABGB12_22980 [Actinocorallia sp. B10E7]|uniref:hypothetical protein n=1 Tax=Actinocorallia sp. B10E7 TaxID=3153558 RepID=UPI00325C807B
MPVLKTSGFLLAAALSLGLALTGCGADTDETASPGAGDGGTSQNDRAVEYARCMRENGVPAFPDPVDGRFMIKGGPGQGLDPQSEAFKSAQEKCKEWEPPGMTGNGGGQAQEQMLEYVSCMRKNGVPKFPDPEGGRLRLSPDMGVDPESPAFKQAEEACKDLLPGGGA